MVLILKKIKKKKGIDYTELLPIAGYQRQACSCVPPTRDTCIMGTKEALERLTRNEKDKLDSEDEWIILKVPKKTKGKFFFADFCDGDSEDEFQWLERPYLMENFTVADLLGIRKALPRSARRRRGLTEFRDDPVLFIKRKKSITRRVDNLTSRWNTLCPVC